MSLHLRFQAINRPHRVQNLLATGRGLLKNVNHELKEILGRKSLRFGREGALFNQFEVEDIIDAEEEHIGVHHEDF